MYPSQKGYTIDARGTGNPQSVRAAVDELSRLSPADYAALIAETRRAPKPR